MTMFRLKVHFLLTQMRKPTKNIYNSMSQCIFSLCHTVSNIYTHSPHPKETVFSKNKNIQLLHFKTLCYILQAKDWTQSICAEGLLIMRLQGTWHSVCMQDEDSWISSYVLVAVRLSSDLEVSSLINLQCHVIQCLRLMYCGLCPFLTNSGLTSCMEAVSFLQLLQPRSLR